MVTGGGGERWWVSVAVSVHDTENLTFSADYRVGDLEIAAQPSAYVCTDN